MSILLYVAKIILFYLICFLCTALGVVILNALLLGLGLLSALSYGFLILSGIAVALSKTSRQRLIFGIPFGVFALITWNYGVSNRQITTWTGATIPSAAYLFLVYGWIFGFLSVHGVRISGKLF